MLLKIAELGTVQVDKIDITTERGKEFKKVFEVKAFPTYLFLDDSIEVFRSRSVKKTYAFAKEQYSQFDSRYGLKSAQTAAISSAASAIALRCGQP